MIENIKNKKWIIFAVPLVTLLIQSISYTYIGHQLYVTIFRPYAYVEFCGTEKLFNGKLSYVLKRNGTLKKDTRNHWNVYSDNNSYSKAEFKRYEFCVNDVSDLNAWEQLEEQVDDQKYIQGEPDTILALILQNYVQEGYSDRAMDCSHSNYRSLEIAQFGEYTVIKGNYGINIYKGTEHIQEQNLNTNGKLRIYIRAN